MMRHPLSLADPSCLQTFQCDGGCEVDVSGQGTISCPDYQCTLFVDCRWGCPGRPCKQGPRLACSRLREAGGVQCWLQPRHARS